MSSNTVGLRELRNQTSDVMKRVRAGETVEITDHGHIVAQIVPYRPRILEQLFLSGRAIAASSSIVDLLEELDLPKTSETGNLPSIALEELRSSES
ncbi:MAG: type II toxin-antitoxin system prevent-host-death family antitoxin [Acidimicrobiales bacterium]|nr:type II toxin-antitoxin system prevent-host-death family antitoxin [Acidimicrobiales bacterium]